MSDPNCAPCKAWERYAARIDKDLAQARKEIQVLTDALHDLREQAQGRVAKLEAELEGCHAFADCAPRKEGAE